MEDGKTRLGELDEEFIYERRVGETILLGTGRWQILDIGSDRVLVAPSGERDAQMPFWRGEGLGRDVEFGRYFGAFLRECERRLADSEFEPWLMQECKLDAAAAQNVRTYLENQRKRGKKIPNDRVILLDAFPDELGEPRLAFLSPFGRAFHLAFLLAALATFRKEGGDVPLAVHSDAGILFKLGNLVTERAVELMGSIRPDTVQDLIVEELEDSAFFGMHFRQNAARALLLPRLRPGRRTPLWLQRLRARDLLAFARGYRSFPIVVETYREAIEDLLPIRELIAFLKAVESGQAQFVLRRGERPSPFAASLLFDFTALYLYEWDEPKPIASESRVDHAAVQVLLEKEAITPLFDPEAIAIVEERLQALNPSDRARDGTELVELLRRIGDLTEDELGERAEHKALEVLPELLADGRIARVELPGTKVPVRFIAGEDLSCYTKLEAEDLHFLISRYITSHALVAREEILVRYPISKEKLEETLGRMELVTITRTEGPSGFCDPQVATGIRRLTLSRRRREVRVFPPSGFTNYLLRFQHLSRPRTGVEGTRDVLAQLAWCYLPTQVWPRVLGTRVRDYRRDHLDMLLRTGEFVWRGFGHGEGIKRIAFCPREEVQNFLRASPLGGSAKTEHADQVLAVLREQGASFLGDIAAQLNEPPSQVAAALWELMWVGLVTNDSFAAVWAGRPHKKLWRPGRKRARGWVGGASRWSAFPLPGGELTLNEIEAVAQRLLARYGLLCRETLELEQVTISWGKLYPILTRLEWQGAVERGLFVSDLSGAQFALRETVEGLLHSQAVERPILLSTCDPANLYGPSSPFPIEFPHRETGIFRRHPANFLVMQNGRPVLAIEKRGERLTPLGELSHEQRRAVLALLPELLSFESGIRAIKVMQWDGEPVGTSVAAQDLEAVGFMHEDLAMIYYRQYTGGENA